MSEPRLAVVSSYNTAHQPTCPAVAKLKSPTRTINVLPQQHRWRGVVDSDGEALGMASCCSRYFSTREARTVVWAEEADDA